MKKSPKKIKCAWIILYIETTAIKLMEKIIAVEVL
jgi:hypothetical protein